MYLQQVNRRGGWGGGVKVEEEKRQRQREREIGEEEAGGWGRQGDRRRAVPSSGDGEI